LRDLPDTQSARLFFERFTSDHPVISKKLLRDPGLLSDVLALASWSPLLATTLHQHPDYIQWLGRERVNPRVRTREELGESLARFGLTNSQLEPQILVARFRRRELLRIYLRDIRNTSTIVETTEELSNLADAILEHALSLSQQEMDNRYGAPQRMDERGRVARASFCIVGLGKLGSFELNYASDIDLLFLYSDEGVTSGAGVRGETTNREYFVKLAEVLSRIVGQPSGEGAAYRVDLRLRPHGRDGALASSLDEAVRYYNRKAQPWELQALIRARESSGSSNLFSLFSERLRASVFRPDVTVSEALENVRLAKQKIDRQHAAEAGGFNVKLGSGGIREIEFIAQALQLANGGRDEWLRAPHTLVSLGRLADRGLITEKERVQLFEAYVFLRKAEHRLQMEEGLQTHSVPEDPTRREILAKRMDFGGPDALRKFNEELQRYTVNVRTAFDRIFGAKSDKPSSKSVGDAVNVASADLEDTPRRGFSEFEEHLDSQTSAANFAASIFKRYLAGTTTEALSAELRQVAAESLNSRRALGLLARIASSLEKSSASFNLTQSSLAKLVRFCGTSELFGEMLAANPNLSEVVFNFEGRLDQKNYLGILEASVTNEDSFGREIGALRREWARIIVEIGVADASGSIDMREANRMQSELASASIDAALLAAKRELERRLGSLQSEPRFAVLGLGRLGGRGMDYGSDLDVVLVYDDERDSPTKLFGPAEFYARFSEVLVSALSSLTREGHLYRVDLRLRPDGRNGPPCIGANAFVEYLQTRSVPWEWLAYVKLRAAAGDRVLGSEIEGRARAAVHQAARMADSVTLRHETLRVRDRLEKEKTKSFSRVKDIKYGPGGMLDVYFATRYLQLRDEIPDAAEDRSTPTMLARLLKAGSLKEEQHEAMSTGYALLRRLDHLLRLTIGRSTRLPAEDHSVVRDIARRLGFDSPRALVSELAERMEKVRAAYLEILA
jgi:glutamate-ammonia-ligase adenylyltransferase